MAEGNGADVGSMYGLLVAIGKAVSRHDGVLERQGGMLERHGAMLERLGEVLTQHGERLRALEQNMVTKSDMADLRLTISAYHSSVIGRGLLASELEQRVHRIEGHLDLPPFVHG